MPEQAQKRDPEFDRELMASIPNLRAFAISLCRNVDRGNDLVSDTMVRAISNVDSFERGSNMAAWLFTILRNTFRSQYRKRHREVEDVDGQYAAELHCQSSQVGHIEFREFTEALVQLPLEQREALVLVGASGFSYDEAAHICGCPVGTVKSRINRARMRMNELLARENE